MNQLLNIIKKDYIYDIGIFKNDSFVYFKCVSLDFMSIKVKITKEELKNFVKKLRLNGVLYKEQSSNKYFDIYEITKNNFLIIEFVVNSHIQLPKVILKDFIEEDCRLYYLDLTKKEIKQSSARKFNTELGYFSLQFEEYLSNEYESAIGIVKEKLNRFNLEEQENIDLNGYGKKIKELFSVAWYRNPNTVSRVNELSTTSSIIYGGYKTEDLVKIMKLSGKFDFFKDYTPIVCINKTKLGLVTCKASFSEIKIKNGNLSYIMPLSPTVAIMLLNSSYEKEILREYGYGCYMTFDNEEQVSEANIYIYSFASKLKNEAIIGKKRDLLFLCQQIKERGFI